MELTNLRNENIDIIAQIICNKYKQSRITNPLLSDKYENVELHLKRISKYLNDKKFIIVQENDQIIGFMYAIYINNFKGTVKGALVLPHMHAVIDGYDKIKVYNFLYKNLSEIWANDGCYTHCILLNNNEKNLFDYWFYNGFGMLVIDAVRSLDQIDIPKYSDNITIFQANYPDFLQMNNLFTGINNHLKSAPIFLNINDSTETYDENKNEIFWIAKIDDKIIGYLKTTINEANLDEQNDGKGVAIIGAYVLPEYQRKHIAVRLINEVLTWGRQKGLVRCTTDFETANFEAKSLWLNYFTPYAYGLIRRIDERNFLK